MNGASNLWRYAKAAALEEQGELDAVIVSFQKAIELDPDLESAQRNLTLVLRHQEAPPAPPE